ncbi:MAG: PilN domain-containing protein [Gammaproteobacteria bacterium]|nr:MAG: PilN domain-containing protein [Gammaproteobacteria bacterium]
MPRINLLPWRAELRKARRNQFFIGLGGAVVAAAVVVLLANVVMGAIIDNQRERNQLLKSEIDALDQRIAEIVDLEAKKDSLLARMEIIEQLQRSRPEIVHVFDQLVRTLPDGVALTSVKQTGSRLEITGTAESNTRVSALMRNIDKSGWLREPDLEVVEVKPQGGRGKVDASTPRASEFKVLAKQASVVDEESGK